MMSDLKGLLNRLTAHKVRDWASGYNPEELPPETPERLSHADVVSSRLLDVQQANPPATWEELLLEEPARHIVALDIDYPAHLVESTTPGHYHLYLDVPGGIAHKDYMRLVQLLGEIGIIEPGYAAASTRRGYTSLRPPWRKKDPRPTLRCQDCRRFPREIDTYQAQDDSTPDDYVWKNEGTLNRQTGLFLCDDCYIKAGMPTSPTGWKAGDPR